MDSFDNPQLFQNSSIVQKSSKTGIFSNKRLLVIKNGYLYYFSKVPKGYKNHVPNILTTFTDLPKSSIQIKNILEIRLESTKSSSLIIKFYLKDMIDRQDIRKSIDSQSYLMPNKKVNNESDQWKFMFTTVLQCRLWYNALMKLKEYFKNLDHKFKDFVVNFDPKRNSVSINDSKQARSQSDLKFSVGSNYGNSPDNNSSLLAQSQKGRKTQLTKFDASKFISSIPEKQSSNSSQRSQMQSRQQNSPRNQIIESKVQRLQPSNVISEQDQGSQKGYHPDISHKIEPQIPESHAEVMKKGELFKSPLKQSHLIETINQEDEFKMRQMEQDIREEMKEQVEKQVRQQVQLKLREKLDKQKRQQMKKYKHQVEMKEMKIKQLETEIHINHLANMQKQKKIQQEKRQLQTKIYEEQQKLHQVKSDLQRQIKQENKLKHNQIHNQKNHINQKLLQANNKKWLQAGDSYEVQEQEKYEDQSQKSSNKQNSMTKPTKHQIQVNEFSVQTDQQDFTVNHQDSFEPHFNFSKEMSLSKDLNLSKQTKIRNSFFSDGLVSNRNTLITDRLKIEDDLLDQGQQNQRQEFQKYSYFVQIGKLYEEGISSSQRVQREIKLLRYINYIKQRAVLIVKDYVDTNRPTQCKAFEKGIFSFELACAPGKIMNIGGQSKLIYSNKVHQNLKRTYKVYQKLQVQILKVLKSRKNYPVRVPLCTLVEYKGYTVLVKLQTCSDQIDLINKEKYLKHILSPSFYSIVQLSKTVRSGDSQQFYMIKVLKPFKLTNEQKNSEIIKFENNFYSPLKQIITCRRSSISVSSEKLLAEYKQLNEEITESRNDSSSNGYQLQSELYVLRLIKLMRELKKVYKSMQPFTQQEDHIAQKNKSQFVEVLLSNPTQLLSLIPSDVDYSTFNIQCGYFYSLLQFFLGIRINDPVRQNITNSQYQLVPVVRTFHLASLVCHQYCQKVDKYLSLNNIQAAENCYKLLKKINPKDIQTLLIQAKILLKRKQHSLAQDKIYQLRQMLPLHDLRNIQLNAYLIECYLFMGLQTQALKQIKSSLQYVEYMFGQRKNLFEQNLHLLMAQTLLKMGNIKESIKLYKSLLKHDKIEKESILISFAQTLVTDQRIEPNQTIPFLLQFIDQLTALDKKIQLMICVAKLYLRTHRKDKYLFYLQKAFQLSIVYKNYDNILVIYQLLMEQTSNKDKQHQLYLNFTTQVDSKFLVNEQNCKKFNTINLYQKCKSLEKDQCYKVISLLNLFTKQTLQQYVLSTIQMIAWQKLDYIVNSLLQQQQQTILQEEQNLSKISQVLQSVNIQTLSTLLASNSKNL